MGNNSNEHSTEGNAKFKAVFFDMGGVVIRYKSPEIIQNLTKSAATNIELKTAMENYEVGLTSIEETKHLIEEFFKLEDAQNLEEAIVENFMGDKDQNIAKAIVIIRQNGLKTGLLTNNGFWTKERTKSTIIADTSMFDIVLESCRLGIRKPDPTFYQMAADKLGLDCSECIFLDDLASNCKGAESTGMAAIQVANGDSRTAVEHLGRLLDMKLI
ncbi:haloacid dehalogenase-like hydrolase domain-containing protein [Ditylenchus destructor]|nr:haloacid dehalogenase-like hydrolase domain-containing protein [Ditylenchus destructor]